MFEGFGGDEIEFKVQVNAYIAKKLKVQERVFQTQLKNVKIIATQEAIDFIKSQTEAIAKHITVEHHKLI